MYGHRLTSKQPVVASSPSDDLYPMHGMNTSGLSGVSISPEMFGVTQEDRQLDSPARILTKEFDFLAGNGEDDLFRDMEQALQEQKVLSREAHMSLLLTGGTYQGFSDTDSSSSAEVDTRQSAFGQWLFAPLEPSSSSRRFQGYGAQSISSSTSMLTNTGSEYSLPPKRVNPQQGGDVPKRKRRTKTTPKKERPLHIRGAASPARAAAVTGSPAASKAEFERTIASLSTARLHCLIEELAGVREGKERVYVPEGAKPPEQALRDAEGRAFVFKKVIPHQHKPERTGDPSPRCFACAARMMHERALANARSRNDTLQGRDHMSNENIEAVRQIIIASLGLPQKTRVFEYEVVDAPSQASSMVI